MSDLRKANAAPGAPVKGEKAQERYERFDEYPQWARNIIAHTATHWHMDVIRRCYVSASLACISDPDLWLAPAFAIELQKAEAERTALINAITEQEIINRYTTKAATKLEDRADYVMTMASETGKPARAQLPLDMLRQDDDKGRNRIRGSKRKAYHR